MDEMIDREGMGHVFESIFVLFPSWFRLETGWSLGR
jgi:hypothetical protein